MSILPALIETLTDIDHALQALAANGTRGFECSQESLEKLQKWGCQPVFSAEKLRPLLRQKLKALKKIVGDDPQAVCTLASGIDSGRIDPAVVEKMPALAAYAMLHWTLDTHNWMDTGSTVPI
jgi:hypothetical protein